MLDRLRSACSLRSNQYGGIKGSRTNHFLISCWDKILTSLDTPDTAVSLLSIDFSKSFNRMDHNICVRALADCGASTELIEMVSSFLSKRKMRFKVGSAFLSDREIRGGSPQGTKLGNFLFVVTIDCLEEGRDFTPPEIVAEGNEGDEDLYGLCRMAGRISAIRIFDSGIAHSSTSSKLGTTDGVMKYFDEYGRNNSTFHPLTTGEDPFPPSWRPIDPWVEKYVDDVNAGERLYLANAISSFSQAKEKKRIRARAYQDYFKKIQTNAEQYGMKVKPHKTQLICISVVINSEVASFVDIENSGEIASGPSIVLLGLGFNNRPTIGAHLDLICGKFYSRSWLIRHLKQAGVPLSDIVKIYATVIRPVIDDGPIPE